jgi:hypothetical protein
LSKRIDLKGKRFGAWYVLSYSGMNTLGQTTWLCRCDCGTKRAVVGQTLRVGLTHSCGCQKGASIALSKTKHGQSRGLGKKKEGKTYCVWQGMHARCRDQKHVAWKYYGGRGIKVCERWKDFRNFIEDMGEAPLGLTLDRINGNGHYEKSNCRWATWTMQARNKRPRGCVAPTSSAQPT